MKPDPDRTDLTIAYAILTENGLNQDVSLIIENGEFVGYRSRSGFETRFEDRDEVEDDGDQGILGWTRLVGGARVGGLARDENSGDHFIYGVPFTNRPANGIVTYTLIGGTSPTMRDNSVAPGVFDGSLAVSFGTSDTFFGLDASVTIAGFTYDVLSEGGLTAPSLRIFPDGRAAEDSIDLPDNSGPACNQGDCRFAFNGFLAGDGGTHFGLAYTIRDDRSNDVRNWVDGVAAFRAGGGNSGGPSGTVRSNQFIAYSATEIGIDLRTSNDVTYSDTSGAPVAYMVTTNDFTRDNERPTIGSATENESGSVGDIIGWTRWADGTTGGRFFANTDGFDLGPSQGWHIIGGTPATNLPASGTVAYELVGATAPTIRDGSRDAGMFNGTLAIAFGAAPTVGLDFEVRIGNVDYTFGTPGGSADPLNGGLAIETTGDFALTFSSNELPVTGTGFICSTGQCHAGVRGFLAGEGASHVGVSYTFGDRDFSQRVDGVAAFGVPGSSGATVSAVSFDWARWHDGGVARQMRIDGGMAGLSHVEVRDRLHHLVAFP
ncbi:hypothetical protein DVR09_13100 [Erythrobacter aureus]|uniref:Uncharacterized protein n=1 Tax=Erythrobacter aureus TaxID=2182384 RepID=A0A345YGT0_9SPHN|nr:hypothetical protein DVR09_13100 [Erythrobacter aureus]